MNATALAAILDLLATLAPALGSTSVAGKVVAALTALLPVVINEAESLMPEFNAILKSLMASDSVSDEDLDTLNALSAQLDAAFDTAADAAAKPDGGQA